VSSLASPRPSRAPGAAARGGRRRPWARAALVQLGWALLTLWVISVIVFAGTNIRPPQDVARQALGHTVTPAQLQAFVHANGLDRPAPVRYASWLGDYVRGDWGTSVITKRPVRADVLPRLWRSLLLAVLALGVSVVASLALGVFMARRRGRRSDLAASIPLVLVSALPEFVVGVVLTTVFAVYLKWLPVDSTALEYGTFQDQAKAYVLPVATLAIVVIPYVARVARSAIGDGLRAPYTRAATLRGLRPRTILHDYAIRNASVPILNAIAINFVYLLGGVIVVENVFGFPGIGQLLVEAIGRADMITVQAVALVLGALVVATSIVTDLLVIYFTPRLRGRGA